MSYITKLLYKIRVGNFFKLINMFSRDCPEIISGVANVKIKLKMEAKEMS